MGGAGAGVCYGDQPFRQPGHTARCSVDVPVGAYGARPGLQAAVDGLGEDSDGQVPLGLAHPRRVQVHGAAIQEGRSHAQAPFANGPQHDSSTGHVGEHRT